MIVLDGASLVFCQLFCWYMPNVKWFWDNAKRRQMMFVDDVPNTPVVLNNMFTGKHSREHGVLGFGEAGPTAWYIGEYRGEYVWDKLEKWGLKVRVCNVMVKIPAVWVNANTFGMSKIDACLPPKERFEETVDRLHRVIKVNARDCDVFICWYPIPDQAHHHFFPTVGTPESLRLAFYWYDKAFRFARELIELARPEKWLVVSDHGFTSDFEHIVVQGKKQPVHIRDALAITNVDYCPSIPIEVYEWILRAASL